MSDAKIEEFLVELTELSRKQFWIHAVAATGSGFIWPRMIPSIFPMANQRSRGRATQLILNMDSMSDPPNVWNG